MDMLITRTCIHDTNNMDMESPHTPMQSHDLGGAEVLAVAVVSCIPLCVVWFLMLKRFTRFVVWARCVA
jgi:hypothetical protein